MVREGGCAVCGMLKANSSHLLKNCLCDSQVTLSVTTGQCLHTTMSELRELFTFPLKRSSSELFAKSAVPEYIS